MVSMIAKACRVSITSEVMARRAAVWTTDTRESGEPCLIRGIDRLDRVFYVHRLLRYAVIPECERPDIELACNARNPGSHAEPAAAIALPRT
ncbi:hypothetical protein GCM10027093_32270 [Paraburkholderia jirisanensis]